jgi:hypothetical protein
VILGSPLTREHERRFRTGRLGRVA